MLKIANAFSISALRSTFDEFLLVVFGSRTPKLTSSQANNSLVRGIVTVCFEHSKALH
jgi:hypothetical protein